MRRMRRQRESEKFMPSESLPEMTLKRRAVESCWMAVA